MDGLGVPQGSAGPVFTSSRVLRWSHMSDDEKERLAKFCAESNVTVRARGRGSARPRPTAACNFAFRSPRAPDNAPPPPSQFFKDTDGSYAANVRLYDASVIDAAATFGSRRPQVRGERAAPAPDGLAPQLPLFRPPNLQTAPGKVNGGRAGDASSSRPTASRGLGPGALFDYSVYPTFVSFVSGREAVKPKERPLPWVMRLIEEIYDSRYAKDTADLKGEADDDSSAANGSTQPFPAFVVEFFSKRYGLRGLVDQNCWDLLYNTHRLRKDHLEVEVFGRFIEEYYDPDDLLFFTYVRSMVQKEVGLNFRARWSEMGRAATDSGSSPTRAGGQGGAGGPPGTITLSYRECQLVSRVVFGSEADPLYKTFMAMVERNMVSTGAKPKPGAMGLPPDSRRIDVTQFMHIALVEYHETRPAEAGGDGGGSVRGGDGDVLLRDAESAYDARASSAGSGSPGGASSAALRPSPVLLEALGEAMHRSNESYLDRILSGQDASSLPSEVQGQIRAEVQAQLEAKVDSILAAVITVTQGGAGASSGSGEVDTLARRFTDLVGASASGMATGGAIQSFCDGVLGSTEVRSTVEQLVQLLVQYATTRLQEAGAK